VSRRLAPEYLFAYAEFGTFSGLAVLSGLREENRTHHWCASGDPRAARATAALKEIFCPSAADWRSRVIAGALEIVARVERGLAAA
jgi:hypothetical protein